MRRVPLMSIVCQLALLAACGGSGGTPGPAGPDTGGAVTGGPITGGPPAGDGALVPAAELFGITPMARGSACQSGAPREFDFWVGHWRVSPNGAPSIITSTLGGCAVLEEWVGGQGRSLNAYDRAARQWTQFYVSAGGGAAQLEGSFRRDSMVLVDRSPPPGATVVWVWTAITRDSVRQHSRTIRADGTLAAQFDGRYRRATQVVPPAVPATPACQGAAFRTFDFLLGDWDVREGTATTGTPSGRLTVRQESNGCLIEERLAGAGGYAALSYAAWLPREATWARAFADDEGRYVFLTGTSDGSRATLTGERPGADGRAVRLRLTWTVATSGRVTQRWESSRDAGATWRTEREYTLVKR